MTPREQAARGEPVPNPRHCTKILAGGRGGVAGGRAPIPGTSHIIIIILSYYLISPHDISCYFIILLFRFCFCFFFFHIVLLKLGNRLKLTLRRE